MPKNKKKTFEMMWLTSKIYVKHEISYGPLNFHEIFKKWYFWKFMNNSAVICILVNNKS